ncbi:MAG: NTP transferase domain-containing protein, partial [Desulfovibrionales bacterium]
MQPADVHGVILAAGKGTRMHSDRPKVMQEILGEPLLWYVIQALMTCTEKITVVTGHGAEEVETHPFSGNLDFVRQERQLGTGHALQAA